MKPCNFRRNVQWQWPRVYITSTLNHRPSSTAAAMFVEMLADRDAFYATCSLSRWLKYVTENTRHIWNCCLRHVALRSSLYRARHIEGRTCLCNVTQAENRRQRASKDLFDDKKKGTLLNSLLMRYHWGTKLNISNILFSQQHAEEDDISLSNISIGWIAKSLTGKMQRWLSMSFPYNNKIISQSYLLTRERPRADWRDDRSKKRSFQDGVEGIISLFLSFPVCPSTTGSISSRTAE